MDDGADCGMDNENPGTIKATWSSDARTVIPHHETHHSRGRTGGREAREKEGRKEGRKDGPPAIAAAAVVGRRSRLKGNFHSTSNFQRRRRRRRGATRWRRRSRRRRNGCRCDVLPRGRAFHAEWEIGGREEVGDKDGDGVVSKLAEYLKIVHPI